MMEYIQSDAVFLEILTNFPSQSPYNNRIVGGDVKRSAIAQQNKLLAATLHGMAFGYNKKTTPATNTIKKTGVISPRT